MGNPVITGGFKATRGIIGFIPTSPDLVPNVWTEQPFDSAIESENVTPDLTNNALIAIDSGAYMFGVAMGLGINIGTTQDPVDHRVLVNDIVILTSPQHQRRIDSSGETDFWWFDYLTLAAGDSVTTETRVDQSDTFWRGGTSKNHFDLVRYG